MCFLCLASINSSHSEDPLRFPFKKLFPSFHIQSFWKASRVWSGPPLKKEAGRHSHLAIRQVFPSSCSDWSKDKTFARNSRERGFCSFGIATIRWFQPSNARGHHEERACLERKPTQAEAWRGRKPKARTSPRLFSYFSQSVPIFCFHPACPGFSVIHAWINPNGYKSPPSGQPLKLQISYISLTFLHCVLRALYLNYHSHIALAPVRTIAAEMNPSLCHVFCMYNSSGIN